MFVPLHSTSALRCPPQERRIIIIPARQTRPKMLSMGRRTSLLSSGQVKQFNLGLLFLIVVVLPLLFCLLLLPFTGPKITRTGQHQNAIALQPVSGCGAAGGAPEMMAFILFFGPDSLPTLAACLPVRPELSNKFSLMWTFVCLLR